MRTYVTVKQLAERYNATERSIWRWAQTGVLPQPTKIGGATRWDLELIERCDLDRNKESGAA